MSCVFVISDLHLSHKTMALRRGFKDEKEHDAFIIDNWNSVVTKRDMVFIIGDVTMEDSKPYHLLSNLRGIKKVILGNHDRAEHINELLKYVIKVYGVVEYKHSILSHIPIHESQLTRFKKNIHGHLHENSLQDARYINVSCEVVNYRPQPIELLLKD